MLKLIARKENYNTLQVGHKVSLQKVPLQVALLCCYLGLWL